MPYTPHLENGDGNASISLSWGLNEMESMQWLACTKCLKNGADNNVVVTG